MQSDSVTRGSLILLGVASVLAGCAEKTTLCKLPIDRSAYAGKVLTVEGDLLVSDHASAVIEPSCDRGISVKWWEKDVPRMSEFDAAAQRLEALERIVVRVRVTGTVKQARRSEFVDKPYWYLGLTSAEVLSVKPRQPSS